MERKYKLGAGALTLVLAAGVAVGTGGGVATATPITVTLTGPVTCALSGSYGFSPGLTNAGGSPSTVTVKAKLTGCSGIGATNGTVHLTNGKLLATSATPVDNSFGAVTGGEALPVLTGTITWRATGGKVTATTVTLTNQAIVYNTTTGVVTVFVKPVLSGGASFSGQPTTASGVTANLTGVALSSKAGHAAVKSIAFGGPTAPTVASFVIGA